MTKPLSEMTRSELVDACIKGQQRSADLAAHVEDVRSAYSQKIAGLSGNEERSARLVAVGRVLNQSPTTSLARLKAQWQAKGAQLTADSIRYEYEGEIHQDRIADHADEVAAELRSQAEEDA